MAGGGQSCRPRESRAEPGRNLVRSARRIAASLLHLGPQHCRAPSTAATPTTLGPRDSAPYLPGSRAQRNKEFFDFRRNP